MENLKDLKKSVPISLQNGEDFVSGYAIAFVAKRKVYDEIVERVISEMKLENII